MKDNRLLRAFGELEDSHFRAEELAAVELADPRPRKPGFSKKLYIAMIAAATAASLCVGASAGANMASGFTKKKGYSKDWNQPTISFSAANSQNCPDTIERTYLPSTIPDDADYHYSSSLNDKKTEFSASYIHVNSDMLDRSLSFLRCIRFKQWTKEEFSRTFRVPDFVEMSETTVNGCPAYLFAEDRFFGSEVTIVWDNGDYIMEIYCLLPVNKAMEIAESVSENENALVEEG